MDIIRTDDILGILEETPIYSLSELAERFADREEVSEREWCKLKNNLSTKLRRLVKSRRIVINETGMERRWELKESRI